MSYIKKYLDMIIMNVRFRHFGELYLGLKAGWISQDYVLDYCQNGLITTINTNQYE